MGRQVRRHVGGQGSSTTAITQANKKWGDGETGKETSGGTRQQRHGHHTGKQEVGRQVRRQVGGQGSSGTAVRSSRIDACSFNDLILLCFWTAHVLTLYPVWRRGMTWHDAGLHGSTLTPSLCRPLCSCFMFTVPVCSWEGCPS